MKKRGYSVTALLLSFVMALSVTAGSFSVPAYADEFESVETVETVEEAEAIEETETVEEAVTEIETEAIEAIEAETAEEILEIGEKVPADEITALKSCGIHFAWLEKENDWQFNQMDDLVEVPFVSGTKLVDVIDEYFTGNTQDIAGWYYKNEEVEVPVTEETLLDDVRLGVSLYPYYNKVMLHFHHLPFAEGSDFDSVEIEVNGSVTCNDLFSFVPEYLKDDSRIHFWRITYPSVSNLETPVNKIRECDVQASYGVLSTTVHFYYRDVNGNLQVSVQTLTYDSDVEGSGAVLSRVVIPQDAEEGTSVGHTGYHETIEQDSISVAAEGLDVVLVHLFGGEGVSDVFGFFESGSTIELPKQFHGKEVEAWEVADGYEDTYTVSGDFIITLNGHEGLSDFYMYALYEFKNTLNVRFSWECVDENDDIDYHYYETEVECDKDTKLIDIVNEYFPGDTSEINGWYYGDFDSYGCAFSVQIDENTVVPKNLTDIRISPFYNVAKVIFLYSLDYSMHEEYAVEVPVNENTSAEDLLVYAPDEAKENPKFTGWKLNSYAIDGRLDSERTVRFFATYGIRNVDAILLYTDKDGKAKISKQNFSYDSNVDGYSELDKYIVIPEDAAEGTWICSWSYSYFGGDMYALADGTKAFYLKIEDPNRIMPVTELGLFEPGDVVELPHTYEDKVITDWYFKDYDFETYSFYWTSVGFEFTVPDLEGYDWVRELIPEYEGDSPFVENREIYFCWYEFDENEGCFNYYNDHVSLELDDDVKVMDIINEYFTDDCSTISGWFVWAIDDETEETYTIKITDDTVFGDWYYYALFAIYNKIEVQFEYPNADGELTVDSFFVDVDDSTTLEDLALMAPDEAKENPSIKGWVPMYPVETEQVNMTSEIIFTADIGVIDVNIILVYRGQDGKLKESIQPISFDTGKATQEDVFGMLVLPEDAEEGTLLPEASYPDALFGCLSGNFLYVLGDCEPIFAVCQWSDEEEEDLGVYETGDTIVLPTEHEGKTITSWKYSYYNLEEEQWIGDDCGFTFVVPETDRGIFFHPVYEEVNSEVKNGIYEEDGVLYYYADDQKLYAGLIQIDDAFYYVQGGGVVSTGKYYVSRGNGIMDKGHYQFAEDGKMILNGIVKIRDEYYYYEDSKVVENAGLVLYNQYYYYIGEGGKAMTGTVDVVNTNGIVAEGSYEFGADGKMVLDGIIYINGALRYYKNGAMRSQVGMIEIDGDLYYVSAGAKVYTGLCFVGGKTNGLCEVGKHYFDPQTGKMVY